ncbi:hypothetical protein B0H19DRAFT_1272697 [Mycena capillaripes]|nr:hypothetical protein B0H19DRAFT_1272697 [Mycena capillaripes]
MFNKLITVVIVTFFLAQGAISAPGPMPTPPPDGLPCVRVLFAGSSFHAGNNEYLPGSEPEMP